MVDSASKGRRFCDATLVVPRRLADGGFRSPMARFADGIPPSLQRGDSAFGSRCRAIWRGTSAEEFMRRFTPLASLLIALALRVPLASAAEQQTYDVVVYGGTSGAVAAAIQAKKMGKTVVLVSP